MFKASNEFEKFESKVWLSSPTMHGPEIEYVTEAYGMSKVGHGALEGKKVFCSDVTFQLFQSLKDRLKQADR